MSKLIQKLTQQHLLLSDKLLDAQRLGINNPKGRNILKQVKEELHTHLSLEDEQLYPILWEKAESNPQLKDTLEKYTKTMEKTSTLALNFFKKYENNEEEEFSQNLKNLIQLLCKRIAYEEAHIYKIYNEIISQK